MATPESLPIPSPGSGLYSTLLSIGSTIIDPAAIKSRKFNYVAHDAERKLTGDQPLGVVIKEVALTGEAPEPLLIEGRTVDPALLEPAPSPRDPAASPIGDPDPSNDGNPANPMFLMGRVHGVPLFSKDKAPTASPQPVQRGFAGALTFVTPIGGFECPYYSAMVSPESWLTLLAPKFPDLRPDTKVQVIFQGKELEVYYPGIKVQLDELECQMIHLLLPENFR